MRIQRWVNPGSLPATLAVAATLSACGGAGGVRGDRTPREAYEASLRASGLWATDESREWVRAGSEALDNPTPVAPPFEEDGVLTPERPSAMGYQIHVDRGRRLRAEVTLSSEAGTRMFAELFRMPADSTGAPRLVAWTDSASDTLVLEPWDAGDFVLRLQPELRHGGRYRVVVREGPQLAFPVEGRTIRAVRSRFGAPRDGGRRLHEGIDIFAPRGTPVLAAASGVVSRVRITTLGGKVVWVLDPARGVREYYAHLDSQVVHPGQPVDVGDTLGFVGNTGNALTTRTHLHFGIYRRGVGAVDPYPFVRPAPRGGAGLASDLGSLGGWAHARDSGIRLRTGPEDDADVLRELDTTDPLRVLAASGAWYRVRLDDGSVGYVAARLVDPDFAQRTETSAAASQRLP